MSGTLKSSRSISIVAVSNDDTGLYTTTTENSNDTASGDFTITEVSTVDYTMGELYR